MLIRFAKQSDLSDIFSIYNALFAQSIQPEVNMTYENLVNQFKTFPDGMFVGEYEGKIVGYSMCFIIDRRWSSSADMTFLNSNTNISAWHSSKGKTAFGSSLAVLPEYRKYNFAHDLFKAIVIYIGDTYKSVEWVLALCAEDNRSRKIHYRLGYNPVFVCNDMFNYVSGVKNGILMEIPYNTLRTSFTNGVSEKWFGVRNNRPQLILDRNS